MRTSHEFQADLIISLQTSDHTNFKRLINQPTIDESYFIFQFNNTIFHELAKFPMREKKLTEFLELIISFFYQKHSENASKHIETFLNIQTAETKYSPLHQAVTSGKLVILIKNLLKEYIRLGGNHKLKTAKGQTLSHLACIKGLLPILTYLKFTLNQDLQELDLKGTSCLHLAAQSNNFYLGEALIAWGCKIDQLDSSQNSPLHYSVCSVNYKVARALLEAGADTKIKNSVGSSPLDLAKESRNRNLCKLLKETGCVGKLNPFKHPIRPSKELYWFYAIFLGIYLLRYIAVLLFIVPHLDSYLQVTSVVIFLITTVSFMLVSRSDPGFVKRNKSDIAGLYQTFLPEFLCPFCMAKKPPRARHCIYCKRCVKVINKQKYDHHCPWIRNCIGKNNEKLFFFFITVLCIDFLYNSLLGLLDYFLRINKFHHRFLNSHYQPEAALLASCLSFVSFLFAFPVFCIQLTNCIKHKTTHERFAFSPKMNSANTSESSLRSRALLQREKSIENIFEISKQQLDT